MSGIDEPILDMRQHYADQSHQISASGRLLFPVLRYLAPRTGETRPICLVRHPARPDQGICPELAISDTATLRGAMVGIVHEILSLR